MRAPLPLSSTHLEVLLHLLVQRVQGVGTVLQQDAGFLVPLAPLFVYMSSSTSLQAMHSVRRVCSAKDWAPGGQAALASPPTPAPSPGHLSLCLGSPNLPATHSLSSGAGGARTTCRPAPYPLCLSLPPAPPTPRPPMPSSVLPPDLTGKF